MIEHNTLAKEYYKQAKEFTERVLGNGEGQYNLSGLTYGHAVDEVIDEEGIINIDNVWKDDNTYIFQSGVNIENELSNFNQHRLAVIRHKIETNLAIAIYNYNDYSGATNEFQMPELKEDEWDYLINNIAVISFLQGLPIGGKTYNGYTIVTNSESKEVVLEENIYILGDNTYYRVGDENLEDDGNVNIQGARLNLDFKRQSVLSDDGTIHLYYYPIGSYDNITGKYSSANASYDSIVTQNKVTTYQDIYEYVNNQSDKLKQVFYTALGRERAGKYKSNVSIDILKISETPLVPEEPETPEVTTYTVTYNTNGGTGTVTSQTRNVGDSVTLMDGNTLIAPSGTHFKGWCTNSNGTGTLYSGSSRFDYDVTLYAIWEGHTSECYEEHVHTNACYSNCVNCGEMGYRHDSFGCDNFEAELECRETRKLICEGTE